jgi:hypothetical protein
MNIKIYFTFVKNTFMRILYFIFLFIFTNSIYARELDGYIIKKNGEKIQGVIQVTSVNYPGGAVAINNINYLPLYISVFFKENGTKQYIEYFADDIDGYSFIYDNQEIFFFSIQLTYHSWNKVKYRKKFLRLLINGELILFDCKSQVLYGKNYNEQIDYYISDRTNQILNVADNKYNTLEEYLIKELKIEKEFLRNQTFKISIQNLKEIIYNYNRWLKTKDKQSD